MELQLQDLYFAVLSFCHFVLLFNLLTCSRATGSSADERLHGGSRVALENRNYENQATCGGAGAGLISRLNGCVACWLFIF